MDQAHIHTVRRLNISVVLNLVITLTELIGGVLSGSLSLLADALHNFTDTLSILLSSYAYKLSLRPPDISYSYGYKRAGILAGLINLILLFITSLFILKEGIERSLFPQSIHVRLMLLVAIIGLIANILSALFLFKDAKKNLNIKTAFLHIIADVISSFGVIIAAIVIYFTHFYFIDTIISFLISIYLIYHALLLAKEIYPILMQKVPEKYNLKDIAYSLSKLKGIENIHHIHVWALDERDSFLECHVKIREEDLSKIEEIKRNIKHFLSQKFNINHSTIEFEIENCSNYGVVNSQFIIWDDKR